MAWCGKHAPAKPGLCPVHNIRFDELHDKEIKEKFGVEALFYCSVAGCRQFDWHTTNLGKSTWQTIIAKRLLGSRDPEHIRDFDLTEPFKTIALATFENAALLAILFHKQGLSADDDR